MVVAAEAVTVVATEKKKVAVMVREKDIAMVADVAVAIDNFDGR